ncbi:AI-2E family transporter [Elizabethkingia anophelis]|uniref:AI-2E family transporter n=1 Tax=Elizabethkingia anophelis TaxID=1117645 RepID=A0AAU8V2H0_9FLAO|nr:AI-2E family transporter [Elizabethkingia anophelis]AQX03122.1 AI-2E family transporter [Elizabethkingia anophelis]MCL1688727.1 AI-2E family transporter [Elizabethkingia anophelis]MCT3732815.1 AI-2E family transporter [Elizabethkingia anophelis]MCT3788781.1 AI-2E family transporter [Elizabethkingia anophelis]MCT4121288.1 AI-2E family transporter [Elizabethkingia anophelis]
MKAFLSWPFYLKLASVLISIMILGYLAIQGQDLIIPMVMGLLFAILLVPVCNFLEKKLRFNRSISAIVVSVLGLALIGFILYLIGVQTTSFSEDWPAFQKQITAAFDSIQDWIADKFGVQKHKQLTYINNLAQKSLSTGTVIVEKMLKSITYILMLIGLTFLFTLFILIYRRQLVRFIIMCFADKHKAVVMDVVNSIQYMVKKYLIGLIIQMVLVTILSFIAYTIIGIKYNFLLAIITGIFNVLPYLGILIATVLGIFVTFATSSAANVLWVLVGMVAVHAVDGNIIMPKIVGSQVKLNSLIVIIGLIVGESIWGVMGMFLTIPIMAIAKIIFDRVEDLKPWGYLMGDDDDAKEYGNEELLPIEEDETEMEIEK